MYHRHLPHTRDRKIQYLSGQFYYDIPICRSPSVPDTRKGRQYEGFLSYRQCHLVSNDALGAHVARERLLSLRSMPATPRGAMERHTGM